MRYTYSLYEAKARLSALVRQVREGAHVVITLHGQPAAELRPVEPEGPLLHERLDRLVERGIVVRGAHDSAVFKPMTKRAGALKRFLAERD